MAVVQLARRGSIMGKWPDECAVIGERLSGGGRGWQCTLN